MRNSRNITKTKNKKNKKPNSRNDVSEVIVINPTSFDSQSIEPNISNNNSIQTSYNVTAENQEEVEKHVKKEKTTDCTDENLFCKFPMNRINRIVRSEVDLRLTLESVFLINKASEKFLDLFVEKAYESSVNKRKSYVAYQDLSSVVSKQRRLEFISDFLPEKLKMEDALEERKEAGA